MKRVFILLFDSFGMGASADAAQFGDELANTFGHIAECCASGRADVDRSGRLHLPNLTRLGLNAAYENCHGEKALLSDACTAEPEALYGHAQEISRGKDTPSGHWEIAGVPVLFDWGYFPEGFPKILINDFIREADIPGVLANKHASGTEIINELGDEHIRTGKPILYTSGDSVFQLACHEKHFGLDRLYHICGVARQLVNDYNVGRVIARPFLGDNGDYHRTANRRDYSTPPPGDTLLDKLKANGGEVIAIGKVADIYAHHGITHQIKADGNMALFDALLDATKKAGDRELVFVNFVDFDSKYGHRRNVAGYAKALEEMDARLPEFEALLQPGDLAIITADHGCDPTMPGSDHTREYIPVLAFGLGISAKSLGCLETFADIGQSLAKYLNLSSFEHGTSFL